MVNKDYKYKFIFVLIVALIYFFINPVKVFINQSVFILQNIDIELLKDYILGFNTVPFLISLGLMTLQSILILPFETIVFANAQLFGWFIGGVLSSIGLILGSVICFFITRFLVRDFIKILRKNNLFKKIDNFINDYGFYIVVILGFLPFVSLSIIGYILGLTGIKTWKFLLGIAIGRFPIIFINSYVGDYLIGKVESIIMITLIVCALSALAMLVKVYFSKNKIS